jgi:putative PIN family toxin of toxin-antitoxin system
VRLVLDTNTVVSGLFWGGAPGQLQDAARAGKVDLYTSPALLNELARVLSRGKFLTRIAAVNASLDEMIEGYGELARLVNPAAIAPVVVADPDDDHVLACALAAKADLIVSGDSDLLNLKTYQGIPIVGAAQALTRLPQR